MSRTNEPYIVGFSYPHHLMRIMKEQYCRSLYPHTMEHDDTQCEAAINTVLNEIFIRPSDIELLPTSDEFIHAHLQNGKLRHRVLFELGSTRFTFPQDTKVLIVSDAVVIIQHTKRGKPILHGVPEASANRTSSFYRRQTNRQMRRRRHTTRRAY